MLSGFLEPLKKGLPFTNGFNLGLPLYVFLWLNWNIISCHDQSSAMIQVLETAASF